MRNGDLYFVTGRHTHVDTAVIVRSSMPYTAAIKKKKTNKYVETLFNTVMFTELRYTDGERM